MLHRVSFRYPVEMLGMSSIETLTAWGEPQGLVRMAGESCRMRSIRAAS